MTNKTQIFSLLFISLTLFVCCSHPSEIQIGKQIWMTNNLAVTSFRNGDIIPQAKSIDDWIQAAENKKPICGYLDFDEDNLDDKGLLYNWYALADPRGLAPIGWRIPDTTDFKELLMYIGEGKSISFKNNEFGLNAYKLKSSNGGWTIHKSNNDMRFYANQSGYFLYPQNRFNSESLTLWSSVGDSTKSFYNDEFGVRAYFLKIPDGSDELHIFSDEKGCGRSIRCIR